MPHGFLDRKPVSLSVPSFPVRVVKSIESPKEFKIPVTLISTTHTSITANALIDSGASSNFISDTYVKKYAIKTRKLSSPRHIRTVDGSPSKSGNITSYCILRIRVDKRILIGKLFITHLGKDEMILGLPFLQRIKPIIDWEHKTLRLDPKPEPEYLPPSFKDISAELWTQRLDLTPSEIENWEEQVPEFVKFSNKAQELALEENLKAAAKTPEQIVPPYLHDFLSNVFSEEASQAIPPSRGKFDHRIELKPDFEPERVKAYQLAPLEQVAMEEFVKEHLARGTIVPSKSPQACGFFFVGKKDGKLRPCQDYRPLNSKTIKNAYPLPLIPPLLNKLRSAKYFTKIDI